VAEAPLSEIMQNLSFRYTRWINKKSSRTGHLFQGRYKAVLVDADSYLLELIRYIHLDPVRAGIANDAMDYAWSSHRSYLGMETLSWLETDLVLSQFAKRLKTCRKRYMEFVQSGKKEGNREEFHRGGEDGRVLGNNSFLESVLENPVRPSPGIKLADIVVYVSAQYGVSQKELRSPTRNRVASEARAVVGWLARRLGAASTKAVALYFRRDASTLSRSIGKIDVEARKPGRLRDRLDEFINAIMHA